MTTLEVFDPAMCCSTGVCGPQVEPHLARFEADLRWLGSQGAEVRRYNLGQEPGAFAETAVVRSILQSSGEQALPVILVDGRLKWTGHYPTRDELAATMPTTMPATTTTAGDACCAPGPTSVQIGSAPTAAGCC